MIKAKVKEIAEANGVPNAYQLGVKIGVTPNVSARLWNDAFTQIGKVTLNKLCTAFNCQPGDLLAYESDAKRKKHKQK